MLNFIKSLLKKLEKLSLVRKLIIVLVIFFIIKCGMDVTIYTNTPKPYEGFSNPKELIYFYMNGCGHCKTFSPVWDEFTSNYNGDLKLNKYETNEAGSMIEKYKIQGFPTVLLIDEKGNKKEFEGDRTIQGLEFFVSN